MKLLHLTLNKKAFEVMVTGEKKVEFREPTQWIKSRLLNKDGSPKHYDAVKFTNGYGKDKPSFIAEFCKAYTDPIGNVFEYSNGLHVKLKPNHTICIVLGRILSKQNY